MSERIVFGHELQRRLSAILDSAGFELARYIEEPFESLKYERLNPQANLPDVILFHGLEEWHPNSIFASAWTHIGEGYNLKTLKELIPKYPDVSEHDRWVFDDEVDLDEQLDEIVEIVKTRLIPWFDKPMNNPAGMDMRPKHVVSDTQLKEKLHEGIRLSELALEQAVNEGRTEDIERHKHSIEEHKSILEELDS